ncbi:MAG: hypothetical protein A3G34_12890 [Candidatus Lindowbacteria bacterium RIFCSPLOWO2_12_FULL_62_27]|nr:MAG: hypothetical protein A3I06_15165 [Candidatus Lindowbacteria bacterium RIFCSPLOWO2_02_FULL_62_12]OGH62489.1 MAG: hypothetical protein A3G34_12890 [Candidatus Lindowbacteria bacterium RIFCSPLOWO2_12_FULL_62_27]
MKIERLQKFLQYLQTNQLMSTADIRRCVLKSADFDRRIGHLSSLMGYLPPEHINAVLLEQSQTGESFGVCAVRLNLMTPAQIEELLILQQEDFYLFVEAVIVLGVLPRGKITSHVRDFFASNQDLSRIHREAPTDAKIELDREVQQVLGRIREIAALPETAQRACALLNAPGVDLDQVADVLSLDPAIAATLMRVVNSAWVDLASKVKTVKEAIMILGIDRLRSLIIAVACLQKFKKIPKPVSRKFWAHSLATAEWSRQIGRALRRDAPDEMFLCGLLHNIGELVLRQFYRDRQEKIDAEVAGGKNQLAAEKEAVGATHADLGGFLFTIWRLPATIIQSAMLHHYDTVLLHYTPNITTEACIVRMAAALADLDWIASAELRSDRLEKIRRQHRDKLAFDADMTKLDAGVNENLQKIKLQFGPELI